MKKKITAGLAAVVMASAVAVTAAAPASAYTAKENRVWSWVKKSAPVGAGMVGKAATIKTARLTCNLLKSGGTIFDVVEVVVESADGLSGAEEDAYFEYAAATTVGAIRTMCPAYKWQLEAL